MTDAQITDANALIQKATQEIANYQTQIKNYQDQIAALKSAAPKTPYQQCLKTTSEYLKGLLAVILTFCFLIFIILFGLSRKYSRFMRPFQVYNLIFLFILFPMLLTGFIVNFWSEKIDNNVGNAVVGIFAFLAVMCLGLGLFIGVTKGYMKLTTFILLSLSFSFFGIVGIVKHKMDYFDQYYN